MRVWVGLWSSLGLLAVALSLIMIMEGYVVEMLETNLRFIIARFYFQFVFTLILMGLDIVVLYSYLRFSNGISKRAA